MFEARELPKRKAALKLTEDQAGEKDLELPYLYLTSHEAFGEYEEIGHLDLDHLGG